MATQYSIEAFSRTCNQTIREFALDQLRNIEIHDPILAQRMAESFATRLNQQAHMGCTDWAPKIRLIETGMATLGRR